MIQITLAESFPISSATAASQSRLNAEIASFDKQTAELDAAAESLRAVEDAERSPADDSVANSLRSRKISALTTEIGLRRAIGSYYEAIDTIDRPAALNAAHELCETLKSGLRDKLMSLGFDCANDLSQAVERIIATHPGVADARQSVDALQSIDCIARRRANNDGLRVCEARLADVKRLSLAVLG